jgi:uncharacterized protein (DUF1330 family)
MAAYLVVEHTITVPDRFEEYRVKVGPLIAKYGGRYITKAGSHKLLEVSRRSPDRVVAWLGHKNIQHTVRYTELAPDRFKNFWR